MRRTRGSSGINGTIFCSPHLPHFSESVFFPPVVAILPLIQSKTRAFPISTIIIEQYRPPVGKIVVGQSVSQTSAYMLSLLKVSHLAEIGFPYFTELPAGLIDDDETPEEAAIRELREETGYKAESALESSAVGCLTVACVVAGERYVEECAGCSRDWAECGPPAVGRSSILRFPPHVRYLMSCLFFFSSA